MEKGLSLSKGIAGLLDTHQKLMKIPFLLISITTHQSKALFSSFLLVYVQFMPKVMTEKVKKNDCNTELVLSYTRCQTCIFWWQNNF
jgi:hypothetical protein